MDDDEAFEEARRLMRNAALFDPKGAMRELGAMPAGDAFNVMMAMCVLLAERTKMLPQ